MKERKDIDRLFQERFKDFEEHPSPKVWSKIEDRLDKKKKRRVVPLWFRLAGAAAILALLIFVGNLYFSPLGNPSENGDPQIVTVEDSTAAPGGGRIVQPNDTNAVEDAVVSSDMDQNAEKPSKPVKNATKSIVSSSEAVSNTDAISAEGENKATETSDQNRPGEAVAVNSKEKTGGNAQKSGNNGKNQSIAVTESQKRTQQDSISQKEKEAVAANESKTEEEKLLPEEKSLEQIVQGEQAEHTAEEASEKEKNQTRRWALTPNIAPVYYNSFNGSGIAPQFDNNSKEGGVNLSYGVLVSYTINNRLTVRSGLNKIDLSYSTNDAVLSTGAQAGVLQSLNFNKQADALQVESAVRNSNESASPASEEISNINVARGYVNQSLAYFEVPMEIEYSLVENRVGLHLIGGLSTLFLNDNALTFSDNDFTTSLPGSTNLNDVSFSTNVGLGMNYKFTDEIKFNLEPMFKYQLNAYRNNVSDFRPYYLGLYTGLSIKF